MNARNFNNAISQLLIFFRNGEILITKERWTGKRISCNAEIQ